MSDVAFQGEAKTIQFNMNAQTGLTDMQMVVTDSGGTAAAAVTMTEVGATAVYEADFTPTLLGAYTVAVSSASSSPALGVVKKTIDVQEFSSKDLKDSIDANMGAAGHFL